MASTLFTAASSYSVILSMMGLMAANVCPVAKTASAANVIEADIVDPANTADATNFSEDADISGIDDKAELAEVDVAVTVSIDVSVDCISSSLKSRCSSASSPALIEKFWLHVICISVLATDCSLLHSRLKK